MIILCKSNYLIIFNCKQGKFIDEIILIDKVGKFIFYINWHFLLGIRISN
jgi:hypothetical protein